MGVKKMAREGGEETPDMRTNPNFIASFQDFLDCDVNDELLRYEQNVNDDVESSGFVIEKIIFLNVHIWKSDPLKVSSYIHLPKNIKLKKAVVNIQNNDNNICFLLSDLAHLHPPKRISERVTHYTKYENTLNVKDLKFPMSLWDFPKFEKMNNLSVNVYGLMDTTKFRC